MNSYMVFHVNSVVFIIYIKYSVAYNILTKTPLCLFNPDPRENKYIQL